MPQYQVKGYSRWLFVSLSDNVEEMENLKIAITCSILWIAWI